MGMVLGGGCGRVISVLLSISAPPGSQARGQAARKGVPFGSHITVLVLSGRARLRQLSPPRCRGGGKEEKEGANHPRTGLNPGLQARAPAPRRGHSPPLASRLHGEKCHARVEERQGKSPPPRTPWKPGRWPRSASTATVVARAHSLRQS